MTNKIKFLEKMLKLSLYKQKKIKLSDEEIKIAINSFNLEDIKLRFLIGNIVLHQGQRSIPALLEGTYSKDAEIRRSSVYLLGKLCQREKIMPTLVTERLVQSLFDDDPKVRKNSAIMLGKLSAKDAAKNIILAIQRETTDWVRPSMILALGMIGGEEATNYLCSYQPKSKSEEEALHKAIDRVHELFPELRLVKDLPSPVLVELRTFLGLEPILEQELYEKLYLKPEKITNGSIFVQTNNIYDIFTLRTFSEMLIPITTIDISDISEIPDKITKYMYDNGNGVLNQILSFHQGEPDAEIRYRVEVNSPYIRHYIRREIVREVSEVINKLSSRFVNSPSNYNIEFRIIIENGHIMRFLWKPFTISDTRFDYRIQDVPASISPVVAAGILRLFKSKLSSKNHAYVLDPFCGSGTMLIEREILQPCRELVGVDISIKAIEAAKQNINAIGLTNIKLINRDIRALHFDKRFDEIISNMPFGIRVGNHKKNEILYTDFFNLIPNILRKGGSIMLYTQEINLVTRLFNKTRGLKLLELHRFDIGGLKPAVFIGYRV